MLSHCSKSGSGECKAIEYCFSFLQGLVSVPGPCHADNPDLYNLYCDFGNKSMPAVSIEGLFLNTLCGSS
jgi:hypothetical protein